MATYFSTITDEQAGLIQSAPLFFVATVGQDDPASPVGPINLSPKGGVRLHIIDRNRVAYLDYAGSGDATAEHSAAGSPVTVMVCAFDESDAAIIRLYGAARAVSFEASELAPMLLANGAAELKAAPRQVIDIRVDKTATSCGYGVPVMSLVRERRGVDRGRRYQT